MRHLARTFTQALSITALGLALLAFPTTVLADRDKVQGFRAFQHPQGDKHKEHYFDHRADRRPEYRKDRHNRRDAHRDGHRDQRDRAAAYGRFDSNSYQKWRSRRDYGHHIGHDIILHQPRIHRERYYYHPEYVRYRAHYLRYHRGHRVARHHHDDNYLEWVTTMLLLNDILDDD